MTYGLLSEACALDWAWDAHFVMYRCRTVERRLAKQAALALAPEMVIVVFDVDGPGHRCEPAWWTGEREKIRRLFKERGRGYAFTSRGGYKIVYGLREPFVVREPVDAIRWRVSYIDWLADLEKNFGIVADDKCTDWTRLMRLPRTTRDGELQQPAEEIGEAARILSWNGQIVPADDPRCQHTTVAIDVPVPAPIEPDKLMEAAEALYKQWPPRSRHFASLALTGALARLGWSIEAIAEFTTAVAALGSGSHGEPDKRMAQARTTVAKLATGEDISGWSSLVEHMITGIDGRPVEARRPAVEAAVLVARRALGCGPAIDLFADLIKPAPGSVTDSAGVKALLVAPSPDVQLRQEIAADVGVQTPEFTALLDDVATDLPPVVEAAESKSKSVDARPMGMTYRQMRARNIPPPDTLVEGLIPREGVGALSGEPKSGKSWDATYLAVCVAAGKNPYNRFAVQRPRRVFYYYAEDTESAIGNRINAIAIELGLDPAGEWIDRLVAQPRGRPLDVMNTAHLCVLAGSVRRYEQPDDRFALLVLDPLSNIHSGEEDKRDSMVKVMARLHALEAYLGCAVLFVHHSAKESADNKGRKRGGQKMRGSSAVHGAVDFGIYVSNLRGDSKNEFIARVESEMKASRGAGVFDRTLKIQDNERGNAERATFTWSEPEEPTINKNEPKDLAEQRAVTVVQKLWDQGGPLTFDQLKAKIRGGSGIVSRAIEIACDEEWIAKKYVGQKAVGYEITERGRALIRDGSGGAGQSGEPEGTPTPSGNNPLAGMLASMLPGSGMIVP